MSIWQNSAVCRSSGFNWRLQCTTAGTNVAEDVIDDVSAADSTARSPPGPHGAKQSHFRGYFAQGAGQLFQHLGCRAHAAERREETRSTERPEKEIIHVYQVPLNALSCSHAHSNASFRSRATIVRAALELATLISSRNEALLQEAHAGRRAAAAQRQARPCGPACCEVQCDQQRGVKVHASSSASCELSCPP